MLKQMMINNKEVTFYCKAKKTRNGFSHECEMYVNGNWYSKVKINYYNRTWEAYQFQTAMKKAVYDVLNVLYKATETVLKFREDWKRITKNRREVVNMIYNESEEKQFYDEIIRAL